MSSSGYLKREEVIGKSVVSKDAKIVGTVLDLAVSTDGRLAIQVQKKSGDQTDSQEMFIGAQEIQAVGDVILLKNGAGLGPVAPQAPQTATVLPPPPPGSGSMGRTCQKCGYVNSATSKFCIKCGASLMA